MEPWDLDNEMTLCLGGFLKGAKSQSTGTRARAQRATKSRRQPTAKSQRAQEQDGAQQQQQSSRAATKYLVGFKVRGGDHGLVGG